MSVCINRLGDTNLTICFFLIFIYFATHKLHYKVLNKRRRKNDDNSGEEAWKKLQGLC